MYYTTGLMFVSEGLNCPKTNVPMTSRSEILTQESWPGGGGGQQDVVRHQPKGDVHIHNDETTQISA